MRRVNNIAHIERSPSVVGLVSSTTTTPSTTTTTTTVTTTTSKRSASTTDGGSVGRTLLSLLGNSGGRQGGVSRGLGAATSRMGSVRGSLASLASKPKIIENQKSSSTNSQPHHQSIGGTVSSSSGISTSSSSSTPLASLIQNTAPQSQTPSPTASSNHHHQTGLNVADVKRQQHSNSSTPSSAPGSRSGTTAATVGPTQYSPELTALTEMMEAEKKNRDNHKPVRTTSSHPTTAIPLELIASLIATIEEEKVIQWDYLDPVTVHPLPAFQRREGLRELMQLGDARMAAATDSGIDGGGPTILCKGDTGCGKSLIVPLLVVDEHWRGILRGLRQLHKTISDEVNKKDVDNFLLGDSGKSHEIASPIFDPKATLAEFLSEFKLKSRIRVFVSQPTRLAARSLADFLTSMLNTMRTLHSSSTKIDDTTTAPLPLVYKVGERVGYATAMDAVFSSEESEIVFGTTGYLLMALPTQESNGANNYTPGSYMTQISSNRSNTGNKQTGRTDEVVAPVVMDSSVSSSSHMRRDGQMAGIKRPFLKEWALHDEGGALHLIVDEAHKRDTQSDIFVAWAKLWIQHRTGPDYDGSTGTLKYPTSSPSTAATDGVVVDGDSMGVTQRSRHLAQQALLRGSLRNKRRLVVMSATMDTETYKDYFTTTSSIPPASTSTATDQHNSVHIYDFTPEEEGDENGGSSGSGTSPGPFSTDVYYVDDLVQLEKDVLDSTTSSSPNNTTTTTSVVVSPFTSSLLKDVCDKGLFKSLERCMEIGYVEIEHPDGSKQLRNIVSPVRESGALNLSNTILESIARIAHAAVGVDCNVLFFVPGFDDLHRFIQALQRVTKTNSGVNVQFAEVGDNASSSNSPHTANGPALSFVKGTTVVDVITLHSTAIGEAASQLESSRSRSKIIVATNVAESSITLPHIGLVIDSCQEKLPTRARGVTSLVSRIASKSSLQQRKGRTGRTRDGCVIRLLSRANYDNMAPTFSKPRWIQAEELPSVILLAKHIFPARSNIRTLPQQQQSSTLTPSSGPIHSLEHLLGFDTSGASDAQRRFYLEHIAQHLPLSRLLTSLPTPPDSLEDLIGSIQDLVSHGLLCPPSSYSNSTPVIANTAPDAVEGGTTNSISPALHQNFTPHLISFVDGCELTLKGQYCAALALESSLSSFVLNGILYGCVESTLLVSAAISVGLLSTHIHSVEAATSESLEASLFSKWELMKEIQDASAKNGGTAIDVDEVWFIQCFVRKWYESVSTKERNNFADKYFISKVKLRRLDELVVTLSSKVIQILESGAVDAYHGSQQIKKSVRNLTRLRTVALLSMMPRHSNSRAMSLGFLYEEGDEKASGVAPHVSSSGGNNGPTMMNTTPSATNAATSSTAPLSTRLRIAFTTAHFENLLTGHIDRAAMGGNQLRSEKWFSSKGVSRQLSSLMASSSSASGNTSITATSSSPNNGGNIELSPVVLIPIEFSLGVDLIRHPQIYEAVTKENIREALVELTTRTSNIQIHSFVYLPHRRAILVQFASSSTSNNRNRKADVDDDGEDDKWDESLLQPVPLTRSIELIKDKTLNVHGGIKSPSSSSQPLHDVARHTTLQPIPLPAWILRTFSRFHRDMKIHVSMEQLVKVDGSNMDRVGADHDNATSITAEGEEDDEGSNNLESSSTLEESNVDEVGGAAVVSESSVSCSTGLLLTKTNTFRLGRKATEDDDDSGVVTSGVVNGAGSGSADEGSSSSKEVVTKKHIPRDIPLDSAAQLGYSDWAPNADVLEEVSVSNASNIIIDKSVNTTTSPHHQTSTTDGRGGGRVTLADTLLQKSLRHLKDDANPFANHEEMKSVFRTSIALFARFGRPVVSNTVVWTANIPSQLISQWQKRNEAQPVDEAVVDSVADPDDDGVVDAERNNAAMTTTVDTEISTSTSSTTEATSRPSPPVSQPSLFCPICGTWVMKSKARHVLSPRHLRTLHLLVSKNVPLSSLQKSLALTRITAPTKSTTTSDIDNGGGTSSTIHSARKYSSDEQLQEASTALNTNHELISGIAAARSLRGASSSASALSLKSIDVSIPVTTIASLPTSMCYYVPPPLLSSIRPNIIGFAASVFLKKDQAGMFQTPCIFDVGQSRQQALQVLQAAVVHVAGNHVYDEESTLSSTMSSPATATTGGSGGELIVLMNRGHTRMYGFCIVGKIAVHFPEGGAVGAKIISQLEMLGKAVRRLLVSPSTNPNTAVNGSKSSASSVQAVNGTIPSLAYVSDLIIDNLNTVHTLTNQPPSSSDVPPSSSAAQSYEAKHWCSLSCTQCVHEQCETEAFESHRKSTAKKNQQWRPDHPVEVLVSSAILVNLHELHVTGARRINSSHFYQKVLRSLDQTLSLAEKSNNGDASGNHQQQQKSKPPPQTHRIIEAYLVLRKASCLEEVLYSVGCTCPTPWDGDLVAPPILPSSMPPPTLLGRIRSDSFVGM